jgi:hypothetical protein
MIDMEGLNDDLIVLIHSIVQMDNTIRNVYGTGYFITKDLVLTAHHVLGTGIPEKIKVRLVTPNKGQNLHWIEVEPNPIWENAKLDAALIRVVQPISQEVPLPDWGDTDFRENRPWISSGYPNASTEQTDDGIRFTTSELGGTLLALGGRGQGIRELQLGVEYETSQWNGISGAPVFVDGKLVGIIKSSFSAYKGKRLAAVPIDFLLCDPGFRLAIAPKWLQYPTQKTWVLILKPEYSSDSKLTATVRAAIKRSLKDVEHQTGKSLQEEPIAVSVTESLENPERFFQLIEAICAAPIMVFDVTDFEPAVMMFLGIRAVVRRGVTLTTTTKCPDESLLSELPFNIQETKLIDVSNKYYNDKIKNPFTWIGNAIVNGLTELQNHPSYLDLPAYNAVRCPEPTDLSNDSVTSDKALMLCSFNKVYQEQYKNYVCSQIDTAAAPKITETMLDISSPRLVGLALYESIRWTSCCIVDWTQWRANVFFELGVRLACSETGPICLIEEEEMGNAGNENGTIDSIAQAYSSGKSPKLKQLNQLIRLLNPTPYKLDGPIEPFEEAFKRYDQIINNQDVPVDSSAIAHNAVYQTIVRSYYWQQEPISKRPHEELQLLSEAQLGADPQRQGKPQVLFSSNPEFAKELRQNVQERWIAAWYYLKGRYSKEELYADLSKLEQLKKVGEAATQWLPRTPDYERFHSEINITFEELKEIDDLKSIQQKYEDVPIEDLVQTIRHLKTKAKNRRDHGNYEIAVDILKGTIELIQKKLSSTELPNLKIQLASELSDSFGILGGIYRRCALESKNEQDRKLNLKKSVLTYNEGYLLEQTPEYMIVDSYNMVNRLISYILLEPGCLENTTPTKVTYEDIRYDIIQEMEKAKEDIQDQLKEKKRGDVWALANLALVNLLLDHLNPVTAYADFIAASPSHQAYETTLSTLRSLTELSLPVRNKLKEAVNLLEVKLSQLHT